jgi:hypothetical protein
LDIPSTLEEEEEVAPKVRKLGEGLDRGSRSIVGAGEGSRKQSGDICSSCTDGEAKSAFLKICCCYYHVLTLIQK